MQLKYFLFDLDGVLVDTHELQFIATREAIIECCNYDIDDDSEIKSLCNSTITTMKKLEALAERNIIQFSDIPIIYAKKKEIADKLFDELIRREIKIGIVTNGNYNSAIKLLEKIGLAGKYDVLITNKDVIHPKPHAEPYIRAMIALCPAKIESCIIFEDSEIGLQSARATGCRVYHVKSPMNINLLNLRSLIE